MAMGCGGRRTRRERNKTLGTGTSHTEKELNGSHRTRRSEHSAQKMFRINGDRQQQKSNMIYLYNELWIGTIH